MGFLLTSPHSLPRHVGREAAEGKGGSKDRVHAGGPISPDPKLGSSDQAAIPSLASRGQQMPGLCDAPEGVSPSYRALLREGAKEGHEEDPVVVGLWQGQVDS